VADGAERHPGGGFTTDCARCDRLAGFLAGVRQRHPSYHARPVPSFGVARPGLLIVGLAPGLHGANASGRPFTGDYAGILLYETLHALGLATAPVSRSADDGLRLVGCRITNAVRCVPPQNKPTPAEVRQCNGYLAGELAAALPGAAVLALGTIAHEAVLRALDLRRAAFPFGHGNVHAIDGLFTLVDSYHCSRYNTQTRRLTPAMFREVVAAARAAMPRATPGHGA
jgi:uracil-DNA glycosylase family 4